MGLVDGAAGASAGSAQSSQTTDGRTPVSTGDEDDAESTPAANFVADVIGGGPAADLGFVQLLNAAASLARSASAPDGEVPPSIDSDSINTTLTTAAKGPNAAGALGGAGKAAVPAAGTLPDSGNASTVARLPAQLRSLLAEAPAAGGRAADGSRSLPSPSHSEGQTSLSAAQRGGGGLVNGLPLFNPTLQNGRLRDPEDALGERHRRDPQGLFVAAVAGRGRARKAVKEQLPGGLGDLAVDPRHGIAPEGVAAFEACRQEGLRLKRSDDGQHDFVDEAGAYWDVAAPASLTDVEATLRLLGRSAHVIVSLGRLPAEAARAARGVVRGLAATRGFGRFLLLAADA